MVNKTMMTQKAQEGEAEARVAMEVVMGQEMMLMIGTKVVARRRRKARRVRTKMTTMMRKTKQREKKTKP